MTRSVSNDARGSGNSQGSAVAERRVGDERSTGGRSLPAYLVVPGVGLLLATLAVQVMIIRTYPDWAWRLIDVAVYQGAGSALAAGGPLYTQSFSSESLPFTYPPFAAVLFVPLSPLSLEAAGWVMAVVATGAVAVSAWLVLGARGYPRGPGRLGVVAGVTAVVIWLQPFQAELDFGQLNSLLMLLVVADLARSDQARLKGVGVGLAAGIKVVPGIFLLYLLVTGRWRAAAVAAGSFGATVLIGAVVAPTDAWRYWSGTFADLDRSVGTEPSGILNQNLYGLVSRAFGDTGAVVTVVWLVLAVLALAGGLALARRAFRSGDDILGVFVAGLTGLLVSPTSWSFAWVWLTVGLVLAVDAVRRLTGHAQLVAAAVPTLTVLALLAWPLTSGQDTGVPHLKPVGFLRHVYVRHVQSGDDGLQWSASEWVMGNIVVLVGLGWLAAAVLWLLRSHDHRAQGGVLSAAPPEPPRDVSVFRE